MKLSQQLAEALSPPTRNQEIHGGLWTSDQESMEAADSAMLKVLPTLTKALGKLTGDRWKMRKRTQDWKASFAAKGKKGIVVTWKPTSKGKVSFRLVGGRADYSAVLAHEKLTPAYIEGALKIFVNGYY